MSDPLRLNLGSGELPLEGYVNVDAYEKADVQGDLFDLEFHDVDEVLMSHTLEHISWLRAGELIQKIHAWMRPGGKIIVEVPDMAEIMANPDQYWVPYVYGSQNTEGQVHRSGYREQELRQILENNGFVVSSVKAFPSEHPHRVGMPVLEAVAIS